MQEESYHFGSERSRGRERARVEARRETFYGWLVFDYSCAICFMAKSANLESDNFLQT